MYMTTVSNYRCLSSCFRCLVRSDTCFYTIRLVSRSFSSTDFTRKIQEEKKCENQKMEGRQVLTAVSDLILGSCAFYSSSMLWSRRHVHVPSKLPDDLVPIVGCLGFFIISLAAFAGVVRFAKLLPSLHTSVVSIHEKLALLGSLTAIPLIAAEYSKQTKYPEILWIFVAISILSPVVSLMLNKQAAMRELSTTTSFIFIIVVSVLLSRYTVNINGLFGSLCFVVGGLLVGTQGKGMFGLNNVDWFHYILSIGIIALERGMY